MTRLLMFPLLVLASAPVHAADTVRLLVSGDPSSNCNLFISELLRNVPAGADVSIDSIGLGIVRDGSRYVFAPDNLANPSAAVAALDGKVPPTLLAENVTIIDSDRGYLVQWPAKEPLDFVSRLIEKRRADPLAREEWPGTWKAGQGSLSHYGEGANEMLVLDVQGAPPMQGRETVPGGLITAKFEGRTTRIYGICKVRGESARRFAALKTARAESDLALGLGNFVAGKHNSEEMRRLVLDSLLAMKFDALIPSGDEMADGLEGLLALKDKGLPLIGANVVYSEGPKKGQPVLPPYRLFNIHGRNILVLGIIGDLAFKRAHPSRFPQVKFEPPEGPLIDDAIQRAHTQLGKRPDVSILLINEADFSDGNWHVRAHTGQLDVVAGTLGYAMAATRTVRRTEAIPIDRQPLVSVFLNSEGFSKVALELEGNGEPTSVVGATEEVIRVTPDFPPDAQLQKKLFELDIAEAETMKDELLPSPEEIVHDDEKLKKLFSEGTTLTWNSRSLRRLAAHLALDWAHAEVAAVSEYRSHVTAGGRFSAYVLSSAFSAPDRVAVVYLTGEQLAAIGKQAQLEGSELVFANFDTDKNRVAGRPLQASHRYRVAIPDTLFAAPAYANILGDVEPTMGPRIGDLFVQRLRPLRDANGGMTGAYLQTVRERLRTEREVEALWTLSIEQLEATYLMNYLSFSPTNNPYSRVPDQRVQTPSFHMLAAKGGAWITRDSDVLTWRTGLSARFERLFFPALDNALPLTQRELQDSLKPETELRINSLRLSLGDSAYDFIPYVKGSFDTEITPTETGTEAGKDREVLPHRAFLNGSIGIGLFPGNALKELRVGFATQGNLTKPAGRKVQFGVEAGLKFAQPIGKVLKWKGELGVLYFPPAGESEPNDKDVLGLRMTATTGLMFPIFDWLSAGLTVDYLSFLGKTPATSTLGNNVRLGATLAIDRAWKPQYAKLFQ
ncbi:MAG: hypothetical protein K1X64_13965 [Myxococcaceae bacterium]|nr:hypothetical protein [Myxococcaceae bacterium]